MPKAAVVIVRFVVSVHVPPPLSQKAHTTLGPLTIEVFEVTENGLANAIGLGPVTGRHLIKQQPLSSDIKNIAIL